MSTESETSQAKDLLRALGAKIAQQWEQMGNPKDIDPTKEPLPVQLADRRNRQEIFIEALVEVGIYGWLIPRVGQRTFRKLHAAHPQIPALTARDIRMIRAGLFVMRPTDRVRSYFAPYTKVVKK